MKKSFVFVFAALFAAVSFADTETVDGVTYTYSISSGKATIANGYSAAISTSTAGKLVIPTTLGGCPVTTIGASAFRYCSSLTSVTIPDSVTSIDSSAFEYCSSLTSVTIPNSVTEIGSYAFYYCSSLTSVTMPNIVTKIGGCAFSYCSSLTLVTIPDSVTTIGSSAFSGCSSLKEIVVAGGNSSYCSSKGVLYTKDKTMLVACPGAKTSITIPNSVTKIGSCAFSGCISLKSVTIPNSVTSIGSLAFRGCSSLRAVTIPNSVTEFDSFAFYNCSSLTLVTIPNSVTTIGSYAFSGCSSLTLITIPKSVTTIGSSAFEGCSSLTSVTIPNSVTTIDSSAFSGCSSLTSVTIPNSVTTIDSSAFSACSSLKSVTIPGRFRLSNIFPSSYTKIVTATITDGSTSIDFAAFRGCSSLTSVTIPNNVTSIGSSAFYNCSSLTSVTIPNSVTSIGMSAFQGCSSLTSVTIPNSVTSISFWAFRDCSSLTSVTIPNSVTTIWGDTFSGCGSLESVTIPGRFRLSSIFSDSYTKIVTATITDGSTSIVDNTFSGCSSLTSVTIPNSVTEIGALAFERCSSLTTVYVGNGDKERVEELMRLSGVDVDKLTFVQIGGGIDGYDYGDMPELRRVYGPYKVGTALYENFFFAADCKISGLPSGLKVVFGYDIVGTPTKPGLYTVKLTKTVNKVKYEYLTRFEVANYTDANSCLADDYFAAEKPGNAPGKAVTLYQGVADISAMPGFELTGGATKLAISGLPAGLKYNSKTGSLTGVPTKAGDYTVTLTVTKGKTKLLSTFFVKVIPMADWEVGTFNGGLVDKTGDEIGLVTLTTTAAGKISGKILKDGLTWTVSAASFDSYDEDGYHATLTAKSGKLRPETYEIVMNTGRVFGLNAAKEEIEAYFNFLKTARGKQVGKALAAQYKATGLPTAGIELPGGMTSLSLKLAASGAVTATGMFDYGYKATCSTDLIHTWDGDFVYVYFAPNVKKNFGGEAFVLSFDLL